MAGRYLDKTGKYLVVYTTKTGGRGVLNVFKTKARAMKQVQAAKRSKSFKELGFSNPRIILNR